FLLQSSRDRLKSLFIDMLEVPAGHQGAVERALGKSLQVVLVSDKERGVELLSALREGGKGEAVFGLPGFSGFRRERPQLAGRPGFHGWLADVVRGPAEWSGVFEWALGGHALVDSLETAFALASETGAGSPGADFWFWTPDGTGVHSGGALYGGRMAAGGKDDDNAAGGLLQRKAQLAEASARLEELAEELRAAQEDVSVSGTKRETALAEADAARQRMREAERRADEARGRIRVSESQAEALDREVTQYRLRLETLVDRKRELEGLVEELRRELAASDEVRLALENRYQSALEAVRDLEEEHRRSDLAWRTVDQERVDSEARLKTARSRAEYLEKAAHELRASMDRSEGQAEEWAVQMSLLHEKAASVDGDMESIHARLADEERARDEVKAVYDRKIALLEERRLMLRRLQDELREATQSAHQRSLRMEQGRAALQNIRERMFEAHEVDFASDEVEFERTEYDAATAPAQIAELKEKLKNLGNINTGALEDYQAEKARLEEVQKQFDDLDRARQGLDRAIKK